MKLGTRIQVGKLNLTRKAGSPDIQYCFPDIAQNGRDTSWETKISLEPRAAKMKCTSLGHMVNFLFFSQTYLVLHFIKRKNG